MSTQWNPQEPAKKNVKFDALFRDFMWTHLQNPYAKIDALVLKNFILERISAAARQYRHLVFRRPEISVGDWKSIQRRFKTQFNKYRRTITTIDKNEDGWLVDSSILDKRVSCSFWNNPHDRIEKSYEGTIRRIDANTVVSEGVKQLDISNCSSYRVEFDDKDIKYYNIFRFKNEYWRVGANFDRWAKLKFIAPEPEPEPEPCDDPHQKMCTACYVQCVNALIIPCGHACMCMSCAKRVQAGQGRCPICRGLIQRLQTMYYSGVDDDTEMNKLRAELKTTRAAMSAAKKILTR